MTLHFNAKNLTGLTVGRWTVLHPTDNRGSDGAIFWLCRCRCGAEKAVRTTCLTAGLSKSCGCLQREQVAARNIARSEHGQARDGTTTRTYNAWKGMLRRCLNPNATHFDRYGGRGITVCERWKSFIAFRSDMGDCPEGLEIERRNNDGNYEPENCLWATRRDQTRNQSSNRMLTLNGTTMCLSDWAIAVGISRDTITSRIVRYGWSVERALTERVHK